MLVRWVREPIAEIRIEFWAPHLKSRLENRIYLFPSRVVLQESGQASVLREQNRRIDEPSAREACGEC